MFRLAVFVVMLTALVLIAQNDDPIMAKYVDARKDIEAGKLDSALKKLDEAIRGANAETGYPPVNIGLLHYEVGEIYLEKEEFKRAEAAYDKTLTIRLKHLGRDSISTSNAYDRLGQLYAIDARYEQAEKYLLLALEIRNKMLDNQKKNYLFGRSYDNLAELYVKNGQVAKAEQFYRKGVDFSAFRLGNESFGFAYSLTTYAKFLTEEARYKEAETVMKQVLQIADALPNKETLSLYIPVGNMGVVQYRLGRFIQAEEFLLKAVQIADRLRGPDSADIAPILVTLAELYSDTGRIREAETIGKRALQINERRLGKRHTDTMDCLSHLGGIHIESGQYNLAELELQTCLEVTEARLGADHPNVAVFLNSLGILYDKMNLYDKAELTHRRALAIREKKLGLKHAVTAQSCYNLGKTYFHKDDYAKTKVYYDRAIEILHASKGSDSVHMAVLISGVFQLKLKTDQVADLGLIERAVAINTKQYGPNHPQTAALEYYRGLAYYQASDYAKANSILLRSVKVTKASLGDTHPELFAHMKMLSLTQYNLDDRESALRTMDGVRRLMRTHVTSVLPGLSQNDQQTFIKETDTFAMFEALTMGLKNATRENFAETSAAWAVNGKASLHETRAASVQLSAAGNSPQVRKLRDVQQEIASLTLSGKGAEDGQTGTKRASLLIQEKELSAAVRDAGGRLGMPLPWVEAKEIRNQLDVNSVLIDIVKFEVTPLTPVNVKRYVKEAHYAAWITPKVGPVRVVDLGVADEIDKGVAAVRKELIAAFANVKQNGEPAAEKQLTAVMAATAAKVLHPLLKEVGAADNLVISPDGALWLLPWAALPMPDGKYLVEKYTINHVVSGRDLLKSPDAAANAKRVTAPLIIAAPDFNMTSEEALKEAQKLIAGILPKGIDTRKLAKSLGLGNVKSLEGTATEAEAVSPLIEKLYGKPRVHTDREALKSLVITAKSPEALILSTHGYFQEDQKTELRDSTDTIGQSRSLRTLNAEAFEDPLLRCGLLFAGCNKAGNAAGAVVENGILTGSEVVSTDLRGTKLVVLSACETGLGDVRNGEGVAGLRQAFQLAGAECVVATLWQVPDIESAQLMKAFFGELVDKKNRDQALTDAQRTMIQQRRTRFGAAHPYFWAAYTVTGRVK